MSFGDRMSKRMIKIIFSLAIQFIAVLPLYSTVLSEERKNQLAQWFASGMAVYEKDSQLAAAQPQTQKSILPYTQTEADIKMLVDACQAKKKIGDAALPKPCPAKVTSAAGFSKNQGSLLDWMFNVESSSGFNALKWSKINAPATFKAIVQPILAKERQYAMDYVFYHAHDANLGLLFDLYQEIENFFANAIQMYGSENKPSLLGNKLILRNLVYGKGATNYTNATQFIKYWDKKRPDWSDHNSDIKKEIISVNLALFGNVGNSGEHTFDYFVQDVSAFTSSDDLLNTLFKQWGFNAKYKKDLSILYENFMPGNTGHLLQFFIPAALVNQYIYISFAGGIRFELSGTYTSAQKVLQAYRNGLLNPAQLNIAKSFDDLQARLLMIPSLFDPANGIKMFRYTTAGLEEEFGADYRKALRFIVAQMMIDLLLSKQDSIRNGSDPVYKAMLDAINNWADVNISAPIPKTAQPVIAASTKLTKKATPIKPPAQKKTIHKVSPQPKTSIRKVTSPQKKNKSNVPVKAAAFTKKNVNNFINVKGLKEPVTPLMKAVITNNASQVKQLTALGAQVNKKTKSGMTALKFAQRYKRTALIPLLKAKGAR